MDSKNTFGTSNGMKLSIIIPTLNEEKILEQTLSAISKLNFVECEIVVSDGGSKDQTVEIAKNYAHQVLVHGKEHRQNIAEGRNIGASASSGEFLVFIDADVIIPDINNFFKEAISLFEQDQKLVGLTVFLKVLPEHVTLSDKLFFGLVNRLNQIQNNFLHIGAAAGEFQMVRREAFIKIGGYNQRIVVGEDNEFFGRLSRVGRTRVETALHVMHTSRRAHHIGWFNLLYLWVMNLAYIKFFKKSYSKEWKVVR